jgi:hypothetical protein
MPSSTLPFVDGFTDLNGTTLNQLARKNTQADLVVPMGADLTVVANAITVAAPEHRVVGGGTIQTINGGPAVGEVTLKAHGAPFTLTSAANIWATPAGGSLVVLQNSAVILMWDSVLSVWIVAGSSASGASGGGVDFIGAWGVGTAYKKGDVVSYNGNDYMAVNDSTGVAPPAAAVAPALGAPLVTTLPASPFDGQEVVLVDSLTLPTYQWRMRYTASITDANKWVCVGGPDAYAEVLTTEAIASAAYVDAATVGPSVTVPRAGLYVISFGITTVVTDVNVQTQRYVSPKIGAAATADADAVYQSVAGGAVNEFLISSISRSIQKTLNAGDLIKLQYRGASASSGNISGRWLRITPKRVA